MSPRILKLSGLIHETVGDLNMRSTVPSPLVKLVSRELAY